MKNRIKYLAASPLALALAGGALPLLVGAQPLKDIGGAPVTAPTAFKSLDGLVDLMCKVVYGWLFVFLVVLAVIFVLIAAYKYLTAGGEPEKVKAASNVLIYAAVAIVVALFARGLPTIIYSLVPGSGATAAC